MFSDFCGYEFSVHLGNTKEHDYWVIRTNDFIFTHTNPIRRHCHLHFLDIKLRLKKFTAIGLDINLAAFHSEVGTVWTKPHVTST